MSAAIKHLSCASAPTRIPCSGPCQSPPRRQQPPQRSQKTLQPHLSQHPPPASANAFVNRYTKVGGSRKRRRRARRRRSRAVHPKSRRSSIRKAHSSKRRGGIGYRLDLSTCPDGGILHPVRYETKASSMDGGGRKRSVSRKSRRRRGAGSSNTHLCVLKDSSQDYIDMLKSGYIECIQLREAENPSTSSNPNIWKIKNIIKTWEMNMHNCTVVLKYKNGDFKEFSPITDDNFANFKETINNEKNIKTFYVIERDEHPLPPPSQPPPPPPPPRPPRPPLQSRKNHDVSQECTRARVTTEDKQKIKANFQNIPAVQTEFSNMMVTPLCTPPGTPPGTPLCTPPGTPSISRSNSLSRSNF